MQLAVFYVAANHSLACAQFQQGAWSATGSTSNSSGYFSSISNFTAAANTRYLSVSLSQVDQISSALLFFEDTNNDVILLNGTLSVLPNPQDNSSAVFPPIISWTWYNSTSELRVERLDNDTLHFSTPFTASAERNEALYLGRRRSGACSNQTLLSVFYDPTALSKDETGKSHSPHIQPLA